MMKKQKESITKLLSNIGIFYKEQPFPALPYNREEYQLTEGVDNITAHRDFLMNLENQEDKRLETIESKTSNLIAQTAIVFSLLGLFIPLIMDKASDFNNYIKIGLILMLFLSSFFYLLTIHNALKNYQIHKFQYTRSLPSNVMDFRSEKLEKFIAEEVRDLLLAVPKNRHINNRKGTNLLHSYTTFKLANFMTGILVAIFSIAIVSYNGDKNSIAINGPVEIKNMDAFIKGLENRTGTSDTLTLKLKDSIYVIPLKK